MLLYKWKHDCLRGRKGKELNVICPSNPFEDLIHEIKHRGKAEKDQVLNLV